MWQKYCGRCLVVATLMFSPGAYAQDPPKQATTAEQTPKATHSKDEAEIRSILRSITAAMQRRDAVGAMEPYTEDCVVFDISPPRAIIGKQHNVESYLAFMAATQGPVTLEYSDVDLKLFPGTKVAFGDYTVHLAADFKGGGSRIDLLLRTSDLFQKINGKWLIVHEHSSLPVDLKTGIAIAHAPRTLEPGTQEDFWSGQPKWPN